MEQVVAAMLVLVLVNDDGALPVAQQLSEVLRSEHGSTIQLYDGLEAQQRLGGFGIQVADILADRHLAEQLTKHQSVVLVHVDQRHSGDDMVLSAKLWFAGTTEHFVAIAGPEGDPTEDLLNGVSRLMRGFLDLGDGNTRPMQPQVPLTTLVEREAWQPLLGVLAGKEPAERSPREWYYMVLAYIRLKQRPAAVTTLGEFRAVHSGHFLVSAAEALIPPPQASAEQLEELDQVDTALPEKPEPPLPSPRYRYDLTEQTEQAPEPEAVLEDEADLNDEEAPAIRTEAVVAPADKRP